MDQTATLLIALQDVVRAVRQRDEASYMEAKYEAYDYANQFGRDDIAEAVGALPEEIGSETWEQAFSIEEALATE